VLWKTIAFPYLFTMPYASRKYWGVLWMTCTKRLAMKNRPNLTEKRANSLVLPEVEPKQQGLRILARIIARSRMDSTQDSEEKYSQDSTLYVIESNEDD
jgi:hypothetical protein